MSAIFTARMLFILFHGERDFFFFLKSEARQVMQLLRKCLCFYGLDTALMLKGLDTNSRPVCLGNVAHMLWQASCHFYLLFPILVAPCLKNSICFSLITRLLVLLSFLTSLLNYFCSSMRLKKRKKRKKREGRKINSGIFVAYTQLCKQKQKHIHLTQVCIGADSNFPNWFHRKIHFLFFFVFYLFIYLFIYL